MPVKEHIRRSIYKQLNMVVTMTDKSVEELKKTEWSTEFENLMRNRLLTGALRYGEMHDPSSPNYDYVTESISRLKLYRETGNVEYLVDVANFCLVMFVKGYHKAKHMLANDDGRHLKSK